MEPSDRSQRSASQGSLRSTYRGHGQNTYPQSPIPQRQPLRSISGNAAFLQSPGPLESMLKTTTETGDIGIFSIKPFASSATYHHLPRSRPYPAETVPHQRSRMRLSPDNDGHDDRRWLPSYRDTTSEIISLYGSDTQQSLSRSFSPSRPNEDTRSYSLTTCGSRHMLSNKSCAVLQEQPSAGALHRPRSPFPYPARLKRPGIRPASPALTNSGAVDYGRMVEFDCASNRTLNGSYRPSHHAAVRRPPPLSLRHESNRSTASLPSRTTPFLSRTSPGSYRAPSPYISSSWIPHPGHHHKEESSDQSLRSTSLTSIVEMYQMPINNGKPPLRSPGSFYYDYSEGFETGGERQPEVTEIPLCPIPKRTGSINQALILKDDTRNCLEPESPSSSLSKLQHAGGSDQGGTAVVQNKKPTESPEQTKTILEQKSEGCHPIQSTEGAPGYGMVSSESLGSPYSHVPENEEKYETGLPPSRHVIQTKDSIQSLSVQCEDCTEGSSTLFHPGIDIEDVEPFSSCKSRPQSKAATFRNELNSETLDKSSSRKSLPSTQALVEASVHTSNNQGNMNLITIEQEGDIRADSESCAVESTSAQPIQALPTPMPLDQIYERKHRRNNAAMMINTLECVDGTPEKEGSPGNIALDDPLSSTEHGRSSNELHDNQDMPHLMKSLPPLPNGLSEQLHELLGASSLGSSQSQSSRNEEGALAEDSMARDARLRMDKSPSTPPPGNIQDEVVTRSPKLRLRMRASPRRNIHNISTTPLGSSSEHLEDLGPSITQISAPKLRLRVSRSEIRGVREKQGELFPVRSKQCISRDNSMGRVHKSEADHLNTMNKVATVTGRDRGRRVSDEGTVDRITCLAKGPVKQPEKPDGRKIMPVDKVGTLQPPGASARGPSRHVSSPELRVGSAGPRRLRQKISMLRLRIPGTQNNTAARAPTRPSKTRRIPTPLHFTSIGSLPHQRIGSRGRVDLTDPDSKGGRVKRWAIGARRVVRFYVRRTLDRQTRQDV